jgi:hypothetical protein
MNNRLRVLLVLIGAILVVATFTYPEWRSFFIREAESDNFPGLNDAQQNLFLTLPPEQQTAYRELLATADATMVVGAVQAAIRPDSPVPTEEQALPQMTDPSIVATGTFRQIDAIHAGSGTITLYQLPDNSRVLRFEGFRVTNGPNLHVILTRNGDPRDASQVGTDYVDLGVLRGNVGDQHYSVPSEVDLSQYRGVVIYSILFQVVYSTGTLG